MEKHLLILSSKLFLGNFKTYSGGHHDLYQCKPSISTSNVALNANPGTVLKSACPEDSTPYIQSSKLIKIEENLMETKLFVTKIILVTFGNIKFNKNHF